MLALTLTRGRVRLVVQKFSRQVSQVVEDELVRIEELDHVG